MHDQGAHGGAVEVTVGREHVLAELTRDLGEAFRALGDHGATDLIGVEDGHAETLPQQGGDG